jgi:hypothetical protein
MRDQDYAAAKQVKSLLVIVPPLIQETHHVSVNEPDQK